jgi:hypothetical protein
MELAVELPSSIHLDNFGHMDSNPADLDSSTNNSAAAEVAHKVVVGRLQGVGMHNNRNRDNSRSTKAVLSQFHLPRRNDASNHHDSLCYGHNHHDIHHDNRYDLWTLQRLVKRMQLQNIELLT